MSKIVYVSSYLPRECGIATFTEDLITSIDALQVSEPARVIAVNDPGSSYSYGKEVVFQIESNDWKSFELAADFVNSSDCDLVNVQHEFGLFGGVWGEYLLAFLRKLKKPSITTMHTTLFPDSNIIRSIGNGDVHNKVVKEIGRRSSSIVVMTKTAADILQNNYAISPEKVRVIRHGFPAMPFVPSQIGKEALGLEGRTVLSTFGLLSRDKGIQNAIKALPEVVRDWPDILYLIIGQTHPQVRLHEGERYRNRLIRLVKELGLEKNVRFHNRFLTKDELIAYLQATDIYICPYLHKEQLSSGTVTYALGAGRAIVSTPFYYAQEVLADGRGVLCKFKSPPSITNGIRMLLESPEERAHMEKQAYQYGCSMTWPKVAEQYASLFKEMTQ